MWLKATCIATAITVRTGKCHSSGLHHEYGLE